MPTTNPVPSQDPSDLLFNAGKLDEAVNSSANTYTDRLGVTRMTVAGAVNAMASDVAAVEARKNTAINTEIPAAVALVDTAVAQTAAGSATAAKVAAEAARDAAMVGAEFYASEQDGRAASADGEYFKVASDKYIDLYIRVNANESTLVSRLATDLQIKENQAKTLKAVSVRKRPRGNRSGDEKIIFGAASKSLLFGTQRKVPRGSKKLSGGAVLALGGSLLPSAALKKRPRGQEKIDEDVVMSGQSIIFRTSPTQSVASEGYGFNESYMALVGSNLHDGLVSLNESGQIVLYRNNSSETITADVLPWSSVSVGPMNIVTGINEKSGAKKAYSVTKSGIQIKHSGVIMHKLVTGQSLALGSRGFVLDDNGEYLIEGTRRGNLYSDYVQPGLSDRLFTLPGGPRPTSWVGATAFDAAREYANSVAGETPASSYMLALSRLYDQHTSAKPKFLYSISAAGGTDYAGLKKGTLVYTRALEHITAAKSICSSSSLDYSVPSISIVHGESQLNTTQAQYVAMLNEWVSDYRTDIVSVTGQAVAPIAFISQCNTGPVGSNSVPAIPLAQLQAHEENPNIVLIGPKYQYKYFDGYHLIADGYVKLGELEALAEMLTLTGDKWQPLKVLSHSLNGDEITIRLNNSVWGGATTSGPIGKISIDTETVSNPGWYGFRLSSGEIASVSLGKDGASITIKSISAISTGTKLSYALQPELQYPQNNDGRRGCIRDTDTRIISRFDNKPIYNWLCSFEITL